MYGEMNTFFIYILISLVLMFISLVIDKYTDGKLFDGVDIPPLIVILILCWTWPVALPLAIFVVILVAISLLMSKLAEITAKFIKNVVHKN